MEIAGRAPPRGRQTHGLCLSEKIVRITGQFARSIGRPTGRPCLKAAGALIILDAWLDLRFLTDPFKWFPVISIKIPCSAY